MNWLVEHWETIFATWGVLVAFCTAIVKLTPTQKDDNFFLQASMKKEFSQRYSLLLNGKYAYDYLHYLSDPREDVTTMYVNSHFHHRGW